MPSELRFDSWAIRMTLTKLYEAHQFPSERAGARFLKMNKDTLRRILDGTTQQFDPQKTFAMAKLLGASDPISTQLFELAGQTHDDRASGYQVPSNPGNQHADSPFSLLESGADRIDIFEESYIPGLFQIVEYTEALTRDNPFSTETGARKAQEARLERQAEVLGHPSPDMRAVINEHCLLLIAHEPFYEKQVAHMLELTERHNLGIYVLPLSQGVHPAMHGAFMMMGFSIPVDLELVYLESYEGGEWVEELDAVAHFRKLYKTILQRSVELGAYLNGDKRVA